jgi:hypothetical protein
VEYCTQEIAKRKIYSAADMVAYEEDPDAWIVPNVIPKVGKVVVYGDGSTYKTTIMYDLCTAVASGGKMLKRFDIAYYGGVFINSTEDSVSNNKERLMRIWRAHGVHPEELKLWFCHDPFILEDPHDLIELEAYIAEFRPCILLLDPLDSFFRGNENSSSETKPLRMALNNLVLKYQMCVILIHHSTKNKDTIRGSSAFYNWADTVLFFRRKGISTPKKRYKTQIVEIEAKKQRNGEIGHVVSVSPIFDNNRGLTYFVYYNGVNPDDIVREHTKVELYKLIDSANQVQGITQSELAKALGAPHTTVKESLLELEEEGYVTKSGVRNVGSGFGTRAVKTWVRKDHLSKAGMLQMLFRHRRINAKEAAEFEEQYGIPPEHSSNGVPIIPHRPILIIDE